MPYKDPEKATNISDGKQTKVPEQESTPPKNPGTQLASASETNKDMKDQAKRDNATQISKTQTTNVNNQTQVAQNKPKYDDRPIPIAMAQVI